MDLTFGVAQNHDPEISISVTINDLYFSGTFGVRPAYSFRGNDSPTITLLGDLTLDAGGDVTFNDSIKFKLSDGSAHTISIGENTTLEVNSDVSGEGSGSKVEKTGAGTLKLGGANTLISDIEVEEGILELNSAGALGGANLKVSNSGQVYANSENAIASGDHLFTDSSKLKANYTHAVSGGTVTLKEEAAIQLGVSDALTSGVRINFAGSSGTGGKLLLKGNSTTVGPISSSGGAGLIANPGTGQATLTVDFGSSYGDVTFSGRINDDDDGPAPTSVNPLTLVKNGTGTLVLSGENHYSGGTTIKGGTLKIGSSSALGSGGLVFNGGILKTFGDFDLDHGITLESGGGTFNISSGSLTVSEAIADGETGGTLTKTGSGTLILKGANTYTGSTTIESGTLRLGANETLPDTTSVNLTLSGAQLDLDGHAETVKSIAGVSGSTISLGSDGALTVSGNASTTFAGTLSGGTDSSFTKNGTGTLTFSASGTGVFSGALTANSGTVELSGSAGRGDGGWTFNNSAVLKLTAPGVLDASEAITAFYDSSKLSAQALGSITGGFQEFRDDSSLQASASGGSSSGTGVISGGQQDFYNATLLKAGVTNSISDGEQNFNDAAVLTASAPHAITGGKQTFVTSGEFSGVTTVNLVHMDDADVGDYLKTTPRLTVSSVGNGNYAISGGQQEFQGYASLQANHAYAVAGGEQIFKGYSHLRASVADAVVDSDGLSFTDHAALWATASNAVTGVTISLKGDSFVYLGAENALGSDGSTNLYFNGSVPETAGGHVILNGNDTTVGYLASGVESSNPAPGIIANNGTHDATLTVAFDDVTKTFSGSLQDSVSLAGEYTPQTSPSLALTKTGSGTLVLKGENTYTGGTTIESGTLVAAHAQALGSDGMGTMVESGASLEVRGVTLAETLDLAGSGTRGNNGALFGSGIGAEVTGTVFLSNDTSIGVPNSSDTFTLSGTVTQFEYSSGLAKVGPGTLVLSSAENDYGGGTKIVEGTLRIGQANALPRSGAVSVFANATLDVAHSQEIEELHGGFGSKIVLGSEATLTTTGEDSQFDGTISGAGSVNTSGVLSLSGPNTYTGGTTVAAGAILGINGDSVFSGSSIVSSPIGTGELTLGDNSWIAAGVGGPHRGGITLGNAVTLEGNTTLFSFGGEDAPLTFGGTVKAQSSAPKLTIYSDGFVQLGGTLQGSSSDTTLTVEGFGAAILTGTTDSTISTIEADDSGIGVIFVSPNSLHADLTVQATDGGYVGVGFVPSFDPSLSAADVMAHISNKASFHGIFGFDSGNTAFDAPHVFTENLDFSDFSSNFAIGSKTSAVLAGTITPPSGAGYTFAGGGGALIIQSNLVDLEEFTGVTVADSLSVALRGHNTFTGSLSIYDAAVVLDSPHPAGSDAPVSLEGNAYLGATEAFKSAADFIAFFSNASISDSAPILGLDSHGYIERAVAPRSRFYDLTRVITSNLDLSGLGSTYLGTYTSLVLAGTITPYNDDGVKTLYLTAVDDGHLTVSSNLSSGAVDRVVIGHPSFHVGGEGGMVELTGSNSHTGGTTLQSGTLLIGSDSALGSGDLTVQGDSFIFSNELSSLSSLFFSAVPTLASSKLGGAVIGNAVVLDDGSDLLLGAGRSEKSGYAATPEIPRLTLTGDISGSGRLWVMDGRTVLTGEVGGDIAIVAQHGALIFGSLDAIPSSEGSPLASNYDGYIGLAVDFSTLDASVRGAFLSRFDGSSTFGTIGFDTLSGTAPNTFGIVEMSDLGFNGNVRLGSATFAKIAGTIIPATDGPYRFGGGGGKLEVSSNLTDEITDESNSSPRGVVVESPADSPLTLLLSGSNTYSEDTIASQSAVIFKPGSLPAIVSPKTSNFMLNAGGYIGLQLPSNTANDATNFAAFLEHFPTSTHQGFVGLDSETGSQREVSIPISLSGLNSGVYLGTTTQLKFTGALSFNGDYRFAGYKGGQLEVATRLTGGGKVIVGDPNTPATEGYDGALSRVALTAADGNNYSGGTTLYAGELVVGHNTALGSGALTVERVAFDRTTQVKLSPSVSDLTLNNAITLKDDLNVEVGASKTFTLAGAISSMEEAIGEFPELYKSGAGTLRLTGANSSYSDIYIGAGNVTFASSNAVGNGALLLGVDPSSSATFEVNAVVKGIFGDNSAQRINFDNHTLTIDQQFDSRFAGKFQGSSGNLVIQNTAAAPTRLLLLGDNADLSAPVKIRSDVTVIVGHSNALGSSNTITLDHGTLAIGAESPLSINAAAIRGIGTVVLSQKQTIGSGFTLGPGISGIGELHFDGSKISAGAASLELTSGGTYEWELTDADHSTGYDRVTVDGKVNVNITSGMFTFKLTPVSSNFNMASTYAWTILTASGGITGWNGIDQTKFDFVKAGSFADAVNAGGSFSLSLGNGNQDLILNFNPAAVPEPSTWALLIAGLGIVGFTSLRRKRT